MSAPRTLHVAIPAMNEAAWLPRTLTCLKNEQQHHTVTWICVNQPENWWQDPEKQAVCENNRQTLAYLNNLHDQHLHIIDHSSPGKGWTGKAFGVGKARQVLMEHINKKASADDLIVSLDADTCFDPGYLEAVTRIFDTLPHAIALSNPYYHRLTGEDQLDRAMLRYEIYMRHYAINMWRIGSPYNFTALGSAIALPVSAYRKIGGITAKKSGEDFYFLQKLRKAGWICTHNTHVVYPQTRYSDRVFFGTGPALIKGSQGNWQSYPVYSHRLFDKVKKTYHMFPALFDSNPETPMSAFLSAQFRENDPFSELRKNSSSREQFVKACHQKVDGLRILQFLKASSDTDNHDDEGNLLRFFEEGYPELPLTHDPYQRFLSNLNEKEQAEWAHLDFRSAPVGLLDKVRNLLWDIEQYYQMNDLS